MKVKSIKKSTTKKPKYNIKIDVYENGVAITIKRGKKEVGAKVFEGGRTERQENWINRVIKTDEITYLKEQKEIRKQRKMLYGK